MALVIICGQPCSGKSTVAAQLASMFTDTGQAVNLIDEPSLHLQRDTSYNNTVNEKNTRGQLKSAVDKAVSKQSVTILDSLNNIKGYRYELWCIARAANTRYCMVHVDTPVDQCREWNAAREGDKYSEAIFQDLAGRFERPDSRNRWDAPLFTVRPGSEADPQQEAEVLAAVVAAVSQAATPNPHATAAKTLMPTMATTNPSLSATNTLHQIDQAAQDIVNSIMEAQTSAGGGAAGVVEVAEGAQPLNLSVPVSLAELRRHKRAFLRLATKITFSRLQDADRAALLFADYLRENLAPA